MKSATKYSLLVKSFLILSVLWTIFIASLSLWVLDSCDDSTTVRVLSQARAFFKQVILTRYWNAEHGGVYVPVTEDNQPNPYLDIPNRDVVTRDEQTLTLLNPAYMTRQISEIAGEMGEVQFHITSLNPIRPGNAPEEWEAGVLRNFSSKSDEFYAWWQSSDEKEKVFRYMAPLWTDKVCLNCHAKQGYEEGDLRGGISISIPANEILAARDHQKHIFFFSFFSAWAIGVIGGFFSFRLSRREYMERSRLIEAGIKEVKTLKGLVPICASCKKVRNDNGYWDQIEEYIRDRSDAEFSHGICPDCMKKLYPEYPDKSKDNSSG